MSTALAVIDNADDDDLIKVFLDHAKALRENFKAMAQIAAKLSPVGLKKLKSAARAIGIMAERIDCLALFGRGQMADHLALKDKPLNAKFFMRLPQKTREFLNTKGSPLEILTTSGAVTKPVEACSTYEIARAVDERRGVLSADAQVDRLKKKVSPPKDIGDYEQLENVHVYGNIVVVLGKQGHKIGVPLSTLRGLIR